MLVSGGSPTAFVFVNLTTPVQLTADDVTMLYVKAPAIAEATQDVVLNSIDLFLVDSAASSASFATDVANTASDAASPALAAPAAAELSESLIFLELVACIF